MNIKHGEVFEEHKFLKIQANVKLKSEGYGIMKRCIRCGCVAIIDRQTFKVKYSVRADDYASTTPVKPECVADKEVIDEVMNEMKKGVRP